MKHRIIGACAIAFIVVAGTVALHSCKKDNEFETTKTQGIKQQKWLFWEGMYMRVDDGVQHIINSGTTIQPYEVSGGVWYYIWILDENGVPLYKKWFWVDGTEWGYGSTGTPPEPIEISSPMNDDGILTIHQHIISLKNAHVDDRRYIVEAIENNGYEEYAMRLSTVIDVETLTAVISGVYTMSDITEEISTVDNTYTYSITFYNAINSIEIVKTVAFAYN